MSKARKRTPALPPDRMGPLLDMIRVAARRTLRTVPDGGHGRAEFDELVNEGLVAALDALPGKRPGPVRWPTYKHAVHAMTRYARAASLGLSPAEANRQHVGRRTRGAAYGRTEGNGAVGRLAAAPDAGRASVGRVATLLSLLPADHRRVLACYLRSGCKGRELRRRLRGADGKFRKAVAAARAIVAGVEALDAIESEVRR